MGRGKFNPRNARASPLAAIATVIEEKPIARFSPGRGYCVDFREHGVLDSYCSGAGRGEVSFYARDENGNILHLKTATDNLVPTGPTFYVQAGVNPDVFSRTHPAFRRADGLLKSAKR